MGIGNTRNFTPKKTIIKTNIKSIGNDINIVASVKFIGKAGKRMIKNQCEQCLYRGHVQIDIYGLGISATCDINLATKGWYLLQGHSERPCKLYISTKREK